jgi:hypothetical protein
MTTKPEYPWMQNAIYEPRPTLERADPTPIPLGYRVFLVCAVLAIIGGALAGLAN